MNTDLSIINLVITASPLVQGVMLLLLLASIFSWTVIISKWRLLKKAQKTASEFEKTFWAASDLSELYAKVIKNNRRVGENGLETIFVSGFRDFVRLRKDQELSPTIIIEGTQRSMRVALNREVDALETHLPFLATVGSTSPYLGLFGTVWGIMNSFRALGTAKQATLSMVAPGIAEALIATAIGLFAAIPAVVAYNRYVTDVDRITNQYDAFFEEFLNILQRQAHK
ncbi:MAG: protein TolQ [Gammaproteobacteria bacterium]|nr:protein TolQ [Gammaproteobacteria bacterium]MDH5692181.1 protein TolQ [Gammaproteobacteria bacterium]